MEDCKECIHYNVCVIRTYPNIFEGTQWDKKPCNYFANTADVVPRAEVTRLVGAYYDKCDECRNQIANAIKSEVAREIFEEIEKTLNRKIARSKPQFEKLHRDEKDLSIWGYKDMGYFQGIISTCGDLLDLLDELKNKYAEGQK